MAAPEIDSADGIDVGGILLKSGSATIEKLVVFPPTELTISGGVVTATQTWHTVDTESDDATDDLNTINGYTNGQILLIQPNIATRTIIVKHGTGNISCNNHTDFTMDDDRDMILFIFDGDYWVELLRRTA